MDTQFHQMPDDRQIDLTTLERNLMNVEARDLSELSPQEQYDIIASKVARHPDSITPRPTETTNELLERLQESKETGKPLVVKFGIDPTGPDMHLGHAISILMLRRFQQMGHSIKFVVGDFTAKIGDPSERTKERSPLTDDQIEDNLKSYFDQASLILNLAQSDIEVLRNSEWISPIPMNEWIGIFQTVSASQLFQRQDFQNRIAAGGSVSLAELVYSLFMAYDSVALQPDIEIGGIDQFVNLHWCRELMKINGQRSEVFITVDLLPGTTGEVDSQGRYAKMSKSMGNYIQVREDPASIYAKVMSIPDEIMWLWFRELTEISADQLTQLRQQTEAGLLHPKEVKQLLARVIVGTFNHFDQTIIANAEKVFSQKFGQNKELIPDDIVNVASDKGRRLLDVVRDVTGKSGRELREIANAGGVNILIGDQYTPLTSENLLGNTLEGETIIRIGKRQYFRITLNQEG